MANVKLVNINKVYDGGVKAVNNFNLDISNEEFVVFVGPSGCGKSTTLRMIAGLESITSGELYIDNKLVNDLEPKDRDIAMVFQNYALYPHMTVYENMAFGLKQTHMPKDKIDTKVKEAAEILGISDLLSRKPRALSGGQRQRVALGRSIVRNPKVFLLDEPLSNLDAKLRVQMRSEITKIHERVKTTFIYVTHDQTEAMTMGSRIVVMHDGDIQQVDTPKNLYECPCNVFVATFLGSPQMNILNVFLSIENGTLFATLKDNRNIKFTLSNYIKNQILDDKYIGKEVLLGVRPEFVYLDNKESDIKDAKVSFVEMLGSELIVYIKIPGIEKELIMSTREHTPICKGNSIGIKFDFEHIHLFDAENELSIIGEPYENELKLKLNAINNKISFNVENKEIFLSNEQVKRLNPSFDLSKEVVIGIKPTDAFLTNKENCVEFNGKIEFIVEAGNKKLAYLSGIISDKLFVVRLPFDSKINQGNIKLFIDFNNISIKDSENGDTILTYYQFFENSFVAEVKDKKENLIVSFGKHKVIVSKDKFKSISAGTHKVIIPCDALKFNEESLKLHKNTIIYLKAINEENLGTKKVIYVKEESAADKYLSFICDSSVNVFKEKIKAAIDEDKLIIV